MKNNSDKKGASQSEGSDTAASYKETRNTASSKRNNLAAYYRAENEDDDGYDPYSDRPSYSPLFEPDPWN